VAKAVEAVWEEFHQLLYNFILRQVSNPAEAEDILQEVFLKIHRGLDGLRETGHLRAWVYQITRNAIVDYYRSASRQKELPLNEVVADVRLSNWDEDANSASSHSDASDLAYQEIANCLAPMLDQLPDPYREAVSLVELNGLTQPVVAEKLGLSVPAMKSRVQRGRKKLKKMLEECCHLEFSRSNQLLDYEVKGSSCNACSPSETALKCKT
jgi:RNA polymerase sigma-70 factor (ECF subfamily)